MDRLGAEFKKASEEGRKSFIAYVCAGDPDLETSLEICKVLLQSGVDILELGVPFSDPLADGWTNQCAANRALDAGITREDVFQLVRSIRRNDGQTPIVFYAYYNQIFSQGTEAYLREALSAGVDAVLALDLPPVEAKNYLDICRRVGMKTVFIVAPTTPQDRISEIADASTGFVYYVSREGVTGVREDLEKGIGAMVKTIKANTGKPVVVGFGISSKEQVREVATVADGVVVGSAIVNVVADNQDNRPQLLLRMKELVGDLSSGVRT